MPPTPFTLASASPRRRALLEQAGYRFSVQPARIDESRRAGESPEGFVERVALAKARAVHAGLEADRIVLAADTAVVLDDAVLGKPRDREEAIATLGRLSGREHRVLTSVVLIEGCREHHRQSSSRVRFRVLRPGECEAYWASGESAGKAGSYAIQGRAAIFVEHLEGSYSGVMGLPLFETAELLRTAGLEPAELWRAGR